MYNVELFTNLTYERGNNREYYRCESQKDLG